MKFSLETALCLNETVFQAVENQYKKNLLFNGMIHIGKVDCNLNSTCYQLDDELWNGELKYFVLTISFTDCLQHHL